MAKDWKGGPIRSVVLSRSPNTRAKLGINDVMRAETTLKGFKGKRLTYETTREE